MRAMNSNSASANPRPRSATIVLLLAIAGALWLVSSGQFGLVVYQTGPQVVDVLTGLSGPALLAATAAILLCVWQAWEGQRILAERAMQAAAEHHRELSRSADGDARPEQPRGHRPTPPPPLPTDRPVDSPANGVASTRADDRAAARLRAVYDLTLKAVMADPRPASDAEDAPRPAPPVVPGHTTADTDLLLAAEVFAHVAEGIVVTDALQRIVQVNRAFTEITGYTAAELAGKTPRALRSGLHVPAFYAEMWKSLAATRHWEGEVWNQRKDGQVYPVLLSITAVVDATGTPTHYIGIHQDLSERLRIEANLRRLAWFDVVTSLPNRTLATRSITEVVDRTRCDGGRAALLCLDIDRFKLVNDSMGHMVGDGLLREIARRIGDRVRPVDSVFRGSGATFLVLLPQLEEAGEAGVVAARVLDALRAPFLADGTELRLTASAGVALCPDHGEDATALVKNAEAAMYHAKTQGRDRHQFYDPELNAALAERLRLESCLRAGLERGEFEVHYQPQVQIATSEMFGVEALVRWRHPAGGLVPPMSFIPVAEECGLIVPLGEWVLRQACRDAVEWEQEHGWPLRMAVNISAIQFQQRGFSEVVSRALAESGLRPELLELEVTESVVMGNAASMLQTLQELKALGVRLSLDDFGTGYSSLAYLGRMPIDKLKIDKSFISNGLSSVGESAIALAVIGIAERLGLAVIAEGVETQEQADFLVGNGCAEAQGYFYARPMRFEELAAWSRDLAAA